MTHPDDLPYPDMTAALATAGCLTHFVASQPDLAERFARWMEGCPGDLSAEIIIGYLTSVHDVLEPGCEIPASEPLPNDHGRSS